MTYLVLAILASFTISVLVKINETRGINTQVVIAANYISASFLGWAFTLRGGGVDGISTETLFLGLGGGVLWPGGFYLLMWGIRQYGMSLAGTACRLSLSVPVLFALIFLNERMDLNNSLGLLATFFALYLFHPVRSSELEQATGNRSIWFLPLLAFWFGLADLWVNLFNRMGPASEKFLFVTLIFTFSNLPAWGVVLAQRISPDRKALIRGLILGIPNFFTTYFLMESLRSPAFLDRTAVAYTLYSVMGVTLAFSAGVLVWREQVTRTGMAGFLAAVVAITLLNR